jgi:carbon-monoxide dehydrogenase large subunit
VTSTWVGRRLRRFEDPSLVRGEGSFVADVAAATDTAALRFIRSPFARGRITEVDAPDDAVIFTADDLEGVGSIRPLLHRPDFTPLDQPVLARDQVTFAGQAIAVVVADSFEEAEDVSEQVFVDIEPLDPVIDMDGALADDAPLVHDGVAHNTLIDARMETDGFVDAFQHAGNVVSVEIRSHRQSAMPLEARGGHAHFDRSSGRVTLTTSTQAPHMVRTAVSDLLGIAEADLRVVAPDVGGAFGQKYSLAVEDVVAVWVARRLRRSVAWIEDRRENFTSSFHSRDHRYVLEGAFTDEGRLVALRADITCNVGAYSCYPVTCGVEPLMAMAEMPGPYDFREYSARARAVTTNLCPIAPYRGVSRPVITLSLERLMDTAAKRLSLDVAEIRRRNLITTFPYKSATGLVYDEATYVEALDEAIRVVDLDAFRARQAEARRAGRYMGIGFSTFSERTGYGTSAFAARSMDVTLGFERVEMAMDPSGYVEVRIGTSPHGQGLATSLAQVVADELGLAPEKIRIVHGDTDRTPYGWGTFASRSMVLSGGASKLAATKLREKLSAMASDALEVAPEDLEFDNGRITVRGTSLGIDVTTLARNAYHRRQFVDEGLEPGLAITAAYDPHGTFSNACHVAIVEVDPETGLVSVERFVVAEDAGLLVNPMIADGQIHGGVAQGIAIALLEELVYDGDGNLVTTSLMDFLPPTMSEIPAIEIAHLQSRSDATLTGAKGLGEGGTIGAPAAVVNAVTDALSPLGIEVFEIPATPERIRKLIRDAKGRQ